MQAQGDDILLVGRAGAKSDEVRAIMEDNSARCFLDAAVRENGPQKAHVAVRSASPYGLHTAPTGSAIPRCFQGTVLFLGLLVAGVVRLVRGFASGDRDQARRILDDRFAAGEISAQEYQERHRLLR